MKTKRTHYSSELASVEGKAVTIEGWVHDVRMIGNINFIIVRDKTGFTQVVVHKKKADEKILQVLRNLHQEDVVSVTGQVVPNKESRSGFELTPSSIVLINKAQFPLPLDPREVTKTNLDTQLDWRFLYFRTEEGRAIFRIQDEIARSFRAFFSENGYQEIQSPVIISSATEGGADLFSIKYFEKDAYLAQSPQLYKQMGAISFEKVFTILPIFRAEKFNTPTHLNEIRQMDIEQAFSNDEDVMKILENCFVYILKNVKRNRENELKHLGQKLTVPDLPLRRVAYSEAVELLQKNGESIKWGDDFTKPQEQLLNQLVKEDVFLIKDWPTEIKAFYAMPYEDNPKVCRAFDLIYKGLEICSGTQRIHLPELLARQIKSKGLDPENFKFYIDSFRYGAPPHSGWSIGLERLTMKICGLGNIREATMFPRDRTRITP